MLTFRREARLLTDPDKEKIEEELVEYRRQGVFTEFENCETASEMKTFKDSLKRIQKEHRLKFRTMVRKLDEEIKRIREDEEDTSRDQYKAVISKKREPQNEEEVDRLFGSLV